LAPALSGDIPKAETFVADMLKRRPTDTLFNAVGAPSIRAAIELNRNNPAKAIELLHPAVPYDLSGGPSSANFVPTYLRGQAFLRLRQGNEAAAEFQKIVDHPGVAVLNPVHALAQLGLARAAALAGDPPKSRRAYQDFLALWKDADPDIPILQEAKSEYDKLQ